MNTTYTAPSESIEAAEARVEFFDETFPYWEQAVNPDRFVPEAAFPVAPVEPVGMVTVSDWEAYAEANWSDPAERHF